MILSGRDPDVMRISDWCDVAWAYLMRQTPMLANPHEYREMLWQVLYVGELTPEMRQKAERNRAENAKHAIGKAPPPSALKGMEDLMRQAALLRGEDPDAAPPAS